MSTDDGVADVTEFAALLTELKGRTERSYGSLARRLGMNTSTLHRYCAGEAVPQDFAPVERLAEFCGAAPEERLELHRRWLRAVAARQRARTTATSEAPEPGETPAARETREAYERSETPGTAALPVTRATREKPVTTGAPETSETATSSATAKPSETPAEAKGRPTADTQARKPDGKQVPPRRWYRRRRTTVALGVACALLATLGTLSALPGGGRPSASGDVGRSAGSAPAVPRTTDSTHSPAPGAGSTTSPTPGTASPSARPARSSPAPDTSPAGGKASEPASGVPLAWTVDSQVWALGCGHDYVIDKPPTQVPPPPAEQDAGPWATAQGAVHGRETNVEISVQGRNSTAVVLTALRVRVVGRAAPVPGTAYAMDQGCGGSLSKRYFAVDLDKDRPVAHSVAGNDAGTPIPAVSLPYRVSSTDPEVLLVTARTETCACDWYLELDWSSQGRTGTVRIDDRGRPFRTSGIKGLPRYWYGTENGERQWVPTGD
ncbi:helix-turn-helix domain-containing protein [Streptomyces sp. NBC_01334]|uniref:helix-turn-helix domain-containing protein n=1 Tax=Streptomyces sp. NBC_01334 TaxID=2903827 RepID=UPI003FA3559F|nr:helix-turn-helix domain-containing protein [Streptomyces sp. NBC_01334]